MLKIYLTISKSKETEKKIENDDVSSVVITDQLTTKSLTCWRMQDETVAG